MNIRFCEFCSNVLRDESTHCPVCGTRLIQAVSEEQFNDSANPWPFEPVSTLCLRIQGQPRLIRFSGTHSVYHLWSLLHSEYDKMRLYYRFRKEEMELFAGKCLENCKPLDPGILINCKHRKFSFHAYQKVDPDIALEPDEMEMTYQGSFEIEECPPKSWGNVLGWLLATAPRPEPDNQWTYEI